MKFAFLVLFLKLIQQTICNGPGTLFVQLVLYQNPSGKTDSGKDCDSWFHQFVNDKCDLVFNICIKDADIKNQISNCDIGSISTLGHVFADTQRVLFGNMIGFIPNPFNFSLISMPENVKLRINITDDDADGQELISQLEHAIQLPLLVDNDLSFVNKIVLSSRFSEISFKIFGRCAENYHGAGCSKYCKPSFSTTDGHYACDKVTGEKHCLIGWTGDNCRQQDVCLVGNPCHGSSKCSMNESLTVCECPQSLTGRYCEISKRPCDSSPCANRGLCVRNNDSSEAKTIVVACNCPHNFTGEFCQYDVNECDIAPHRCENSADCVNKFGSYYCVCRNNYWGIHCEKPPVYSVIGLDGSFMYKNHQANDAHSVIVILLAVVACLIIVIVALTLLYVKKHHIPFMLKNQHSGSETSVYSQCHYEDIVEKAKVSDCVNQCEESEEPYCNIYEQQFDYHGHQLEINEDYNNTKKDESFLPKYLSETVI